MSPTQVLLDNLSRLNTQGLFNALFRDILTGAFNRRAFETVVSPRETVAIVDLDSLKYVNDTLGHREGDDLLRTLARVLQSCTDDQSVYRLSGDEFVVTGPALPAAMVKAQAVFPGMTYGIGQGLEAADQQLRISKVERQASSARAARGERPSWLAE